MVRFHEGNEEEIGALILLLVLWIWVIPRYSLRSFSFLSGCLYSARRVPALDTKAASVAWFHFSPAFGASVCEDLVCFASVPVDGCAFASEFPCQEIGVGYGAHGGGVWHVDCFGYG